MLETVFDLLFEHAGDRMDKQVGPLDAFFWVNNEHFSEHVFDEWVGFAWESQWLVLDFFEQVNDVVGSVRYSE